MLVGQSQVGVFDSDTGAVWGWFLPTVMPTLSLIVGALVADYRKIPVGAPEAAKPAAGPVFWLGAALSGFYLLLLEGNHDHACRLFKSKLRLSS